MSIVCFVIAAIMAINGVDGWGWFLFVSLLLSDSSCSNCPK
ncbi:hypothetical protein [Gilliamella sp. Pas-s27]|nr:hypothetical protein [Gilliamella sp. Pas-s27]